MYSARMAEPIDCFNSTPPPAHGERPAGFLEEDYGLVFDGLRISVEAATPVFARAVKFDVIQQFRSCDVRTVMEVPTPAEPLLPCWVQQFSVVLPVPLSLLLAKAGPDWATFKDSCKPLLKDLGLELVNTILRSMANRGHRTSVLGSKVHLIGATSTGIKEVSEGLFSFFVKQKWAVSTHERP